MACWAGLLGIGGAILGGRAGAAAQIAGQGVGVYFLKFSREYETEADILGCADYGPCRIRPTDLAKMFRTIEQQGGGSSGGFLSSHPSPSNRYARIQQEARLLRIENPVRRTRADFSRVQARLRSGGRAPSMEEIARSGQRYPTGENTGNYPTNTPRGRVEYPSTRYQTIQTFLAEVCASACRATGASFPTESLSGSRPKAPMVSIRARRSLHTA